MSQILTATEIKNYKDIGKNIEETKVNQVLQQVQLADLKGALGDRFYFDVLSNLENPAYQDLLSGSTFDYYGVTYIQDGLKALLADYFMARYVLLLNTNFTQYAAVTKLNNGSEPTDRNSLKDISTQQLQLAGSRLEIIKYYLNTYSSQFPNWTNNIYGDESAPIAGERTFRFTRL